MAKTDNTPAKPAAIVPAPPAMAAPANGEIKSQVEIDADAAREALDSQLATVLDDKALNAKLDALNKASDADFVEKVTDFWKPEKAGEFIRGVYVGSAKQGRLLQYGIAVKGSDGVIRGKKLNGTHSLTSAMRTIKEGTLIQIKYLGKTQTQGMVSGVSRSLNQFDVQPLK